MMLKRTSSFVAALFVCLVCASALLAQHSGTQTYAITNARIVPVSGPVLEKGTVVVRDGLIAEVGANVAVPADARVIDGTGLTVYPGFVDAGSFLGMPAAAPLQRFGGGGAGPVAQPAAAQPQLNSSHAPGLQPENMAEASVKPSQDQLEQARNAGITSALVSARDGIFRGQSVLINTAGDTPQALVIASPVAQHIGFASLRGGAYPASLMGVFSVLRQMLLDAQRQRVALQTYERDPRGLKRPTLDRSLMALFPVLAREMPVVLVANSEREIIRALDLTEEFKLRTIISGGAESWKVVDRLHALDIPVLLSLNLPKRTTQAVPEADKESLRVLRARAAAPATPAKLAAANVRFAFQSDSMTSIADFDSNLAKMIDAGLSAEAAVRALTLSAAELLGVSNRIGSIEIGKIANLTLVRGAKLDKDAKIADVFVDGALFEIKQPKETGPPKAKGEPVVPIDLTGNWTVVIDAQGQSITAALVLKQQGSSVTGTLESQFGSSQLTDGSVTDKSFTFKTTVNVGRTMDVTISGSVADEHMQGTMSTAEGSFPFTGSKPK